MEKNVILLSVFLLSISIFAADIEDQIRPMPIVVEEQAMERRLWDASRGVTRAVKLELREITAAEKLKKAKKAIVKKRRQTLFGEEMRQALAGLSDQTPVEPRYEEQDKDLAGPLNISELTHLPIALEKDSIEPRPTVLLEQIGGTCLPVAMMMILDTVGIYDATDDNSRWAMWRNLMRNQSPFETALILSRRLVDPYADTSDIPEGQYIRRDLFSSWLKAHIKQAPFAEREFNSTDDFFAAAAEHFKSEFKANPILASLTDNRSRGHAVVIDNVVAAYYTSAYSYTFAGREPKSGKKGWIVIGRDPNGKRFNLFIAEGSLGYYTTSSFYPGFYAECLVKTQTRFRPIGWFFSRQDLERSFSSLDTSSQDTSVLSRDLDDRSGNESLNETFISRYQATKEHAELAAKLYEIGQASHSFEIIEELFLPMAQANKAEYLSDYANEEKLWEHLKVLAEVAAGAFIVDQELAAEKISKTLEKSPEAFCKALEEAIAYLRQNQKAQLLSSL